MYNNGHNNLRGLSADLLATNTPMQSSSLVNIAPSDAPCPCNCEKVTKKKTLYLTKVVQPGATPVVVKGTRRKCDTPPSSKSYKYNCEDQTFTASSASTSPTNAYATVENFDFARGQY